MLFIISTGNKFWLYYIRYLTHIDLKDVPHSDSLILSNTFLSIFYLASWVWLVILPSMLPAIYYY